MLDKFIVKNSHYHNDLITFYKYNIPEGARVLEIGSGTGYLLASLKPSYGVGIDVNPGAVEFAQKKYPNLHFYNMRAENMSFNEKFDYVILSNTLSLVGDVQEILHKVREICNSDTRLIITSYSFLWKPFVFLAEKLNQKSPSPADNWLTPEDIETLLYIENFQTIKKGRRFIFPLKIPILGPLINKYISPLPLLNQLCLTNTIIARPLLPREQNLSVSVIVPVRNEAGNIENAVIGIPKMGGDMEIIFVEGGSSDDTSEKIKEAMIKYPDLNIRCVTQTGKGKANAVREGFAEAKNEILMILDGDLTVSPTELTKFYNVINDNKGEFVYGSRLVYTLEENAMQSLNIIGNKFFSYAFSWLLSTPIKDTLCGTKVMTASNYKKLVKNQSYFGNFDPFGDFDLLLGASKLNLKFVEIPVKYKSRTYGSTNISRFKHGIQLLKMVGFCMNKVKFI